MKRVFALAVTLMLLGTHLAAQSFWEPVEGLYGGVISSVAAAPNGTLFAASGIGIYRSDDGGDHWMLGSDRVASLVTVSEQGTIFAAGDGLYRSADQGGSWTLVLPGTPFSLVADAGGGVLLASAGQHLYRSTNDGITWGIVDSWQPAQIIRGENGLLYEATGNGLFSSSDRGATWKLLKSFPGPWGAVKSVAIAGNGALVVAADRAVYRSTDMGLTWNVVADRFASRILPAGGSALVMLVDDSRPSHMGWNGLYRSTDNGATWTLLPVKDARRIFSGAEGTVFLAGSQSLRRSGDKGASWPYSHQGMRNYSAQLATVDGGATCAVLHGSLYVFDRGWKLMGGEISRVVYMAEVSHIFAERDELEISPPDYAGVRHDLLYSSDAGRTWNYLGYGKSTVGSVGGNFMAGLSPGRIGDSGTVLYRGHGSTTWNRTRFPWDVRAVMPWQGRAGFAAIGRSDDSGSVEGLLLRTTDAGISWEPVADSILVSSISVSEGKLVVVGTPIVEGGDMRAKKIYTTPDNGAHWDIAGDSVFTYPRHEARRWGSHAEYDTAEGTMVSDNSGGTWTLIPWADGPITLLTPGYRPQIYGVAQNGRFYAIPYHGVSWTPYEEGLPANYLATGPHFVLGGRNGFLFASIPGYGLFRSSINAMSAPESGEKSVATMLGALHPNPAVEAVHIPFKISSATHVVMTLHDLLGREIGRPADDYFPAGEHKARFETREFPPGTYYCRLSAGGITELRELIVVK